MIPTLFGIMLVSFVIVQYAPGGPVERVLAQLQGNDASASSRVGGGAGDFGGWVRDNVTALQGARHLLTDANLAALDGFEAALHAPGPIAATRLARLGMYRQTKAGTAALLAAAAAGRLRPIGPRQV